MPANTRIVTAQNTADQSLPDNTFTTLAVVSPVTTGSGPRAVAVTATVVVTAGTGTTAVQVFLRRGPAGSRVAIGEDTTVSLAAGDTLPITVAAVDEPGELAGGIYSVSAQQVDATAAGTVSYVAMSAAVGVYP